MLKRALSFILDHSWIICGGFLSIAALADTTPNTEARYDLSQILKNTLQSNGQIREAGHDIDVARSQLQLARAAMWPKASAIVIAAPIFEERGNALHSQSNWGKWGPYVTGGVEIAQPIYTFGQISSYKKAAEGQITAREGQQDIKRAEILMNAKEFYYGMQMARALEDLVEDLSKFLDEAVQSAEESTKKKNKERLVKPHDLYRLKTALEDLNQKKILARQGKQTAEHAVSWIANISVESIQKVALKPEPYEKKSLEDYIQMAKDKRPEFRALAAGKQARSSLRDAKLAQNFPVLFIGGVFQGGWSPVRDKQESAYANDPYNRITAGAGIGLKFDLEFARHSAEAAEQEAELMKLQATESYAIPGIELQVRKAYNELQQAAEGLEVAERRRQLGKKWFVGSAMGWSIGVTNPKDLLEALEGDGLAKKNYIETVYSLNMALGKLTQAVGVEVTQLKY